MGTRRGLTLVAACAFVVLGSSTTACISGTRSTVDEAPPPLALPDDSAPSIPPPTGGSAMPPKPASSGPLPGCPSSRTTPKDTIEIASEEDFRANVVGIYRRCDGSTMGLEIRVDPDTDRLSWWYLDQNFVRRREDGAFGWIVVDECSITSCRIRWHDEGGRLGYLDGAIVVWNNPIALEIISDLTSVPREEWVRVAD